jgi:hypothetical protein
MLIRKTVFILLIFIILIISCDSKSKEKNNTMSSVIVPFQNLETVINEQAMRELKRGVINADCNFYDEYNQKSLGRLTQGQEIIIGEKFNLAFIGEGEFDVRVEIRTNEGIILGFTSQKNIIYDGGIIHDFWFKDVLLTREYYYTGTAEEIFNYDFERFYKQEIDNIEKVRQLQLIRAFFTQSDWIIFNNYMVMSEERWYVPYRIDNITIVENNYLFKVSCPNKGEYEIELYEDDDGIIMIQYIIINDNFVNLIPMFLNVRYVPYDSDETEKVRSEVRAWITEQIELLGGDDILRERYPL